MKTLEREIGSITFAAGQTRTLPLPRNYAYRSLQLKLVCNLDRVVGASGGAPKDSCPAQLVQNIMIRANGRDVIKNYDFESLHRMDQVRHGTRPHISVPEEWDGFDVISDSDQVIHAQIDFAMPRAIRPIDTLLNSAGLSTLDLIVTFGNPDDVMNDAYDPAAGGITVNTCTLYVAAVESVGVPIGTQFMVNKEYMLRSQVNANSTSHQIQLPVSNLFRSFILKTHADGDQVNTILQNIQIKAGTEVFKNRYAGFLQMDNRLECAMEVPNTAIDAAAIDHYMLNHLLEGYYLLEFVKDGRLTECLDTSRLSSLELLLAVTKIGTDSFIDIFPCELIAPPPSAREVDRKSVV